MARIRNSASTSNAPRSLKRARTDGSPSPSPKRRQDLDIHTDAPSLHSGFSREMSPSKNVHWSRRIISGPSAGDPQRRSQSPTRSALRRPAHELEDEDEDDHDHGDGEDAHDEYHGPSAQLHAEDCQARDERQSPPSRSPKRPRDMKARIAGVGSVHSKPNQSAKGKKSAAALASQQKVADIVENSFTTLRSATDDNGICKQLDGLKEQIRSLADVFPTRSKKAKSDVLSQILQKDNEQLVRYVGCLAIGGKAGAKGWQDLLSDDTSRKAVLWAVVGRALKENVFDELYFGAWPELEGKLRAMEKEQYRQDGFHRQRERADEIKKQTRKFSGNKENDPFYTAVTRVTLGIETLILPLWCLGDRATQDTWTRLDMRAALFQIVEAAGKTARFMRKVRDAIYYWPPTFKDEEFEPARMECLNLNDMIRSSPYDKQDINGRDRPLLREGHDHESQAIVRVVCFPGIQVYRQGGGDLAKRQLATERNGPDPDNAPPDVLQMRRRVTNKYGQEYTGEEGIRTRIISKSVVLLQWGQQRLLTKEAGTSTHIDAVKNGKLSRYIDDAEGEVNLYELFKQRLPPPTITSPQRSPSAMERVYRTVSSYWNGGEADSSEDTQGETQEETLPMATFSRCRADRTQRAAVGGPSSPRSRKGARK